MPDLLVKLYDLNFDNYQKECFSSQLKIVRAFASDHSKVIEFVRYEFSVNWADECSRSFSNSPISCFLAVEKKKIIGFACYDATARGYFGPIGVKPGKREKGIGTRLLYSCLIDMWDHEYGYAIVGWADGSEADFYKKTVSATPIQDSTPGVYKRMIEYE